MNWTYVCSGCGAVQERAQRHEELGFGFFFYCGTTILESDTVTGTTVRYGSDIGRIIQR